jgi:hypothetical protein
MVPNQGLKNWQNPLKLEIDRNLVKFNQNSIKIADYHKKSDPAEFWATMICL